MELFVFVFENGLKLISQVRPVEEAELGDPNYELVEPFQLTGEKLTPWLIDYTVQNTMLIHSDKILTMVKPTTALAVKYEEAIKN
jgi:hypothetical protein